MLKKRKGIIDERDLIAFKMQLQNENEYVESREKDYVKREILEVKDK
ncbi:hypothetical protein [Caldifermentibacillus hisashii]|nr:hypothetical protein [Caldifermentibacillus hisashii]MBU5342543.1 hypothetical protein [Caldifermentibacillus hisashii]